MFTMRTSLPLLAFFYCSPMLFGQEERADVTTAIAPLINDQTVAVMRIELAQLDFGKLQRQIIDPLQRSDADRVQTTLLIEKLKNWSQQLQSQGGGRLYLVFTLENNPDLTDTRGAGILKSLFLAIPTTKGLSDTQAREIESAVQIPAPIPTPTPSIGRMGPKLRKIHGIDVLADESLLEKLSGVRPTPRPEFAQSLSAGGNRPLSLAVVPPPILARASEEILLDPAPGTNQPLGKVLAKGVRWIGVGINPDFEELSANAIIQSENAAAAETLLKAINGGADILFAQLTRRGNPATLPSTAIFTLLPEQKNDQLVLSLDRERAVALKGYFQRALALAQEGSMRSISQNHMKQLNLAILTYADKNKVLPERAIRSKDGKPLLSWRVAILPFIEEEKLYKEFHLDEAWDSEHNRKLIERMPLIYVSPDTGEQSTGRTRYLAPVGEQCYFPPTGTLTFKDITDGTSKTIMLVEADPDHAVIWTKPEDLEIELEDPTRGIATGEQIFNASFGDGSVQGLSASVPAKTLRALFTRNGGEPIDR
jgi:hypothetical protein